MSREDRILSNLSVLKPQFIELINESAKHSKHHPFESFDTHYSLTIKSDILNSKSKLDQHRVITDLIEDEFEKGLHALSIVILP
jgi:BolA protein